MALRRDVLCVLGVALSGILPGGRARAQISVDRLEMTLEASPGRTAVGVLNLRNDGDETAQVTVHLEDWDRDEEGRNRWVPVGDVAGACGARLELFPLAVSLDPGASQAVRISLDSTAVVARECWSAVVVQTERPPREGTGVRHVVRTATKVYVQPPGGRLLGEVAAITVVPDTAGTAADPQLDVLLANLGDVHFVSRGSVQVRTPANDVIRAIELPPSYLLPGARTHARAPLPRLDAGRYVLLAIIDYGGTELAAGQVEYRVR